jgi:hypothetical protein
MRDNIEQADYTSSNIFVRALHHLAVGTGSPEMDESGKWSSKPKRIKHHITWRAFR